MELFHALNRGVDKRNIFLDDQDRARFVHDLWEFNDVHPAPAFVRRTTSDLRNPTSRECIVTIHAWCVMKNHYHLLLSEREEGGITKFFRKLNVGYANYFNERYQRSGTLFQGRTKKILVRNDGHFLYMLHYIHLNPLDFLAGAQKWRGGKITSANTASKYLASYRWSSYQDYCGKANFPSLIEKDLFKGALGNIESATKSFLTDMNQASPSEINEMRALTFE